MPLILAARNFEMILASIKRLAWFEHSTHNPPFEESEKFIQVMAGAILPSLEGKLIARMRGDPAITHP